MFLLSLTIFRLDLRTNHSQEKGNDVSTELTKVKSYFFSMVQTFQVTIGVSKICIWFKLMMKQTRNCVVLELGRLQSNSLAKKHAKMKPEA